MVWPAVHGAWGESGALQAALEAAGVPFVGTPAADAEAATHKMQLANRLEALGYPSLSRFAVNAADLATEDSVSALRQRMQPWLEVRR